MNDIDNEARNVLKDVILYRARVSFLASGIRSIAKFTMKNALVADYMHHTPFFSERQRKQFKENRELLPGTHAWFGGVVTGRRKKTGLYKLSYGEPPSETRHGAKLCVFTWSAECLLLQLVAARWTNLLDLANGWPELAQDPRSNRIMCPFWPIPLERHATWPPQQNISQDHLERVADRFKFVRLS